MTWLFTQVWLWSLAAFLLGSLFTWLLFVVPLRRRLRAMRSQAADSGTPVDASYRDYGEVRHEPPVWVREQEHTARDLPQAEQGHEDEWGPQPTGDRPFREGHTAPVGSWPRPYTSAGEAISDEDESVTAETEALGELIDDSELRLEHDRAEQQHLDRDADRQRQDPTLHWDDWIETVRRTQPPSAPPELDSSGTEFVEWSSSGSTWLHGREPVDAGGTVDSGERSGRPGDPEDPGTVEVPHVRASGHVLEAGSEPPSDPAPGPQVETEEDRSYLSGRLRSLFEPLVSPGIEQGRRDTPYVPPVGAEGFRDPDGDTAAAAGGVPAAGDATSPLPRRTPGASSRPGTPPQHGVAAPKFRPEARSAQAPVAQPETGQETAQQQTGPLQTGRSQTGRPEAGPVVGGPQSAAPGTGEDAGYTIKAHFASRQYHTRESPDFERITAEVWFRTAEDAEQAGFEPWDGVHRS